MALIARATSASLAASPITISRPRNHGSSTSSHSIRVCDTVESGPMVSRILPQVGQPEELAELVSWLASERCSFRTGVAFDLSGGRAVY